MMIAISFDGRVRDDHLIGFFVPASINPGAFCSFQVTITLTNTNGTSTIVSIFTFTAIVPADRKIIFTVPSNVPPGWYHFTILCTVLSMTAALTAAATTTARSTTTEQYAPAQDEAEFAINQSVCTLEPAPTTTAK
jgi:hypothetical protein